MSIRAMQAIEGLEISREGDRVLVRKLDEEWQTSRATWERA